MTTASILLSAILMASVTPVFAQATLDAQSTKMNQSMQDMPMQQNRAGMRMGKDLPCAGQMA